MYRKKTNKTINILNKLEVYVVRHVNIKYNVFDGVWLQDFDIMLNAFSETVATSTSTKVQKNILQY